jgi:hypothetical protein
MYIIYNRVVNRAGQFDVCLDDLVRLEIKPFHCLGLGDDDVFCLFLQKQKIA